MTGEKIPEGIELFVHDGERRSAPRASRAGLPRIGRCARESMGTPLLRTGSWESLFGRIAGALVWGLLLLLISVVPSRAEKRVALVVGNSAYLNVPSLPNPANDAAAVADLFKAAGFDNVQVQLNVGIMRLRHAVSDFAELAADADIAVVYYAGHGMELDGNNYLVPVDAKLTRDFDIDDEALSLDRVLRAIEPARRLRLVILDACRDNPFIKTMKRSVASRSIGRGLAKVEPSIADTLIAFSAKAGSIALDGGGHNSPFTSALLKHLTTPGLDIRLAFGRVRDDVIKSTAQKQEPFVYGSLGGQTISLLDAPAETPPSANPQAQGSDAAQAWTAIKDTTNASLLEAFISYYSGSFYANLARARLKELRTKIATPRPSRIDIPTAPPSREGALAAALRGFFVAVAAKNYAPAWSAFSAKTQNWVAESIAESAHVTTGEAFNLLDSNDGRVRRGFWDSFRKSSKPETFTQLPMSPATAADADGAVNVKLGNGKEATFLMYKEGDRWKVGWMETFFPTGKLPANK